jgi:hypothetical protein
MDKYLMKEQIGEFLTKFYEVNRGKNTDITLDPKSGKLQVYNKDKGSFDYIVIIDCAPCVDGLLDSVSI